MKKIVKAQSSEERLDKYLNSIFSDFSRSFIQNLIEKGQILLNGKVVKSGIKVCEGDEITLDFDPPKPLDAVAQDVDFEIVYEDDDLLVINKPQGLVVHPCSSTKSGTLVNGLLAKVKNLSGINGVLRPGIVHRLDKNTSGLMLVAKNDFAHNALAEMIKNKSVKRKYLALVEGIVWDNEGKIENYLARDKKDRKKYAVSNEGKNAITYFKVIKRYQNHTLVEFSLETGRTHQIRVHSAFMGHSVVGDEVYGKADKNLKGQLLHSYKLEFDHPRTHEHMLFQAPLPDYFANYIQKLKDFQ